MSCLGFPSGSVVKKLPAAQEVQEMLVPSLYRGDPLEEERAPLQYSCLGNAMDREPGGLQSAGLRVGTSSAAQHASLLESV